ncbi:MAG: nitrous-oxide reductase [Myxococcota bacterium]|jgi:nitrous-oxide reductase
MSDDVTREEDTPSKVENTGRRKFFIHSVTAVGAGLAGATILSACGKKEATPRQPTSQLVKPTPTPETPASKPAQGLNAEVKPGQLDDYYGFWSGGQSGEIRIVGVPSMRELKRIPVFNRDSATGWGATDHSKALLGGRSSGDTHHVHLSYKDGTYDGRYIFVNDKASARLARVRIDTLEVDKIVDIPNSMGTHGIFPQRHKTGYVMCNSEFRTPLPNDGKDMRDPKKYAALHTAIDGETMEAKFQVMVEGNLDLCATDYKGLYSFACCYNSEAGVSLAEMMGADQDFLYVFNLPEIEKAVAAGKGTTIGDSKVPVIDARGADSQYVMRVPVPKSPHGVNISPDGKYACCSGKLSPTVSVVDIDKLADAFAGKIKPRDCVIAEPEVGLGPLHTAFDGKGNAYTSIFIDSVMTKWNIDLAIQAYAKGDKSINPVIEKIDVHYQVGHTNASMSETKDADGQWLVALCKFSKDRFLNVGMLHPENDQLVDISGEKMKLVHDGPTFSEPHDAVIVRKDLIHPLKIQPRKDARFRDFEAWAKEDGVDLMKGNKVVQKEGFKRVYMTSQAPMYHTADFTVNQGDTVQIVLTNIDNVEDLTHGFCVSNHDVNFICNPRDTQSYTFVADKAGVYWYYCPWFCHALHLEMRGRMFVEPTA